MSFRLRSGGWLIGRHEDADFVLADPKVSRRHARVELIDGQVLVTDLGSTNGTWLNEQRVTEPTELHDGDRLRLGQIRLRYFDPSTATTDPIGSLALRSLRYAADLTTAPTAGGVVPGPRQPGAGRPDGADEAAGEAAGDRWSGALAGPTQVMATTTRTAGARLAIVLGGCAAVAGSAVAAYQILQ